MTKRKTKQPKVTSLERFLVIIFRPWALFEQSKLWHFLLDKYCVNPFERNHCEGIAKPNPEAVSVYRYEFLFLTALVVLILLPGVLSTWISVPLLFLWLMTRAIRSAIQTTFGGSRIAFDTGGKVLGFFAFGGAFNFGIALLLGYAIEWIEIILASSGYFTH